MKIILIVIGFILLIVLLGIVSVKLNRVELSKTTGRNVRKVTCNIFSPQTSLFSAELFFKLFKIKL